jgi:hypothetical protein
VRAYAEALIIYPIFLPYGKQFIHAGITLYDAELAEIDKLLISISLEALLPVG